MRLLTLRRTCSLAMISIAVFASPLTLSCKGDSGGNDSAPVAADPEETAATAAEVASVTAAKEALTPATGFTFGAGDSATTVTQSFTLSAEGADGSTITWTSSNTDVVSITGNQATVVQPAADTEVTLTATITKGSSSVTKQLILTVKSLTVALRFFGYVRENGVNVGTTWADGVATPLPVPFAGKGYLSRMGVRVGSDVYILGSSTNDSNLTVSGIWKNDVWTALPSFDLTKNCVPLNLDLKDSDLYVSANCTASGMSPTNFPGYWKNGVWTDLPKLDAALLAAAQFVTTNATDVYIAGTNTPAGGIGTGGYWKNNVWVGLPPLVTNKRCQAYTVKFVGADLNVFGTCDNASNNQVIGYWKNGVWNSISDVNATGPCPFGSGFVADSKFYVSGTCGVTPRIWEDGVVTNLPLIAGATGGFPSSVFRDTDSYVAGVQFLSSSAQPGYWKNNVWTDITPATGGLLSITRY
ncbi:MAG: hypothetical protein EOP10_00235 [Proteobacteria bacterium]|nr:MAG: hypothetical protein EOP10_00235 [Pseudomonadota bacterium]